MPGNRKQEPVEVSTRLEGLFARRNWKPLWLLYRLAGSWPDIVGPDVAARSEPSYLQKNILWVQVESSVLMHHLQSRKPALIEQIGRILPEAGITDIRWEMRAAQPMGKKRTSRSRAFPPLEPGEKEQFEGMAETVGDGNCRDALTRLWNAFHDMKPGKGQR
ncbi:MAG: hypothetical protein Kow0089_18180 [Desulfobulbaceae bacterium]